MSRQSKKRVFPFSNDPEAVRPEPKKKTMVEISPYGLSSEDRQVLEKAAKLLNKSVSQLFDGSVEGMSPSRTAGAYSSYLPPEQQAAMPPTTQIPNHQAWIASASMLPTLDHISSLHSSPASFLGPGPNSMQLSNFEIDSWQSVGRMPNGNVPVLEVQQSSLAPRSTISGTAFDPSMPLNEANRGAIEGPGDTSDKSSVTSENDMDVFDAQPWETVQISAVDNIVPPTDKSGADYVWLYDDPEAKQDAISGVRSDISIKSMEIIRVDDNANAIESPQQKGRRSFQSRALRDETSNTRKLKACVRCRMQKIRCVIDENDPTGVCKTCQQVSNQRLYTLPCARYKITECTLYRTGKAPGLEFTFRWPVMKLKDITNWDGNEIREIKIQSDVCDVPFAVSARRFVPLPQDSRKRGWMDGRVKKFKETTPFAIVNMSSALKNMKEYIDGNVLECMNYFLRASDTLVKETYDFVIKHTERHRNDEEGLLMGNYLRLWFAIRRTHTTEHIVSDDTLDMLPETKDKSFPLFGKVPLPPVMVQQLDMILTLGILQPLRKKVLDDLQKLILSNKPSLWMTVYLITFMSLHNCATISNENYKNARKHGLRRRYAMPAFVAERHHAANVFLSHYHYRTQPCDPFKLNWKRRQATPFAELSPSEIHFLIRTKELVEQRKAQFRTTQEISLYEDELYFISQMYEDDWQPRDSIIDFDDGTINDVPLREYG